MIEFYSGHMILYFGTHNRHMIFIFENFKYHIMLIFWEIQVFVDFLCFGWLSYFDIFHDVDIFKLFNHFWSYKGNFGSKGMKT